MGRAHSLKEFKAAISRLAIPMFNTMYADREGQIFYVYNAAVPRRSAKIDWLNRWTAAVPNPNGRAIINSKNYHNSPIRPLAFFRIATRLLS
jgi:acyl-homoserine lactone acylase PvdQ